MIHVISEGSDPLGTQSNRFEPTASEKALGITPADYFGGGGHIGS